MKFILILSLSFTYLTPVHCFFKTIVCAHSGDYKSLLYNQISIPNFGPIKIYDDVYYDMGGYPDHLFRASQCPTNYWTLGVNGKASRAAYYKDHGLNYVDWEDYKKEDVTHVCIGNNLKGFDGTNLKTVLKKGDSKIVFQKYRVPTIFRLFRGFSSQNDNDEDF